MKNIHLLPTEKRSRLYIYNGKLGFAKGFQYGTDTILNQHIYITSDEEIKERDLLFSTKTNNIYKADSIEYLESHNMIEDFDKSFYINSKYAKKIILTTDQDLIKDGVQDIDEKFLEWFVKNPSCEWVEVVDGLYFDDVEWISCYKIIIPKEEPKQETFEEAAKDFVENTMKFSFTSIDTRTQANRMLKCVEFGAKWQQEQNKNLYSEEIINILDNVRYWDTCPDKYINIIESFLKQFKKK